MNQRNWVYLGQLTRALQILLGTRCAKSLGSVGDLGCTCSARLRVEVSHRRLWVLEWCVVGDRAQRLDSDDRRVATHRAIGPLTAAPDCDPMDVDALHGSEHGQAGSRRSSDCARGSGGRLRER